MLEISIEEQEALERADKDQWREREGWALPEEAAVTLSGHHGVRFEFVDPVV